MPQITASDFAQAAPRPPKPSYWGAGFVPNWPVKERYGRFTGSLGWPNKNQSGISDMLTIPRKRGGLSGMSDLKWKVGWVGTTDQDSGYTPVTIKLVDTGTFFDTDQGVTADVNWPSGNVDVGDDVPDSVLNASQRQRLVAASAPAPSSGSPAASSNTSSGVGSAIASIFGAAAPAGAQVGSAYLQSDLLKSLLGKKPVPQPVSGGILPSKSNTLLYVGLGAAALLVVGVVLLRKKSA